MTNPSPQPPLRPKTDAQSARPWPTPWILHPALTPRRLGWVALGLTLIAFVLLLRVGKHDAGARVRYVPVTQKIASGRILIKPLDRVDYQLEITAAMHDAQVIGNFTAYGGATNTVSAVLMQSSEYANWNNDQKADAFYSSDGQKNTDQFALRLGPGSYTFAVSNRLSKTASKYVFLDVELIYYRAETY